MHWYMEYKDCASFLLFVGDGWFDELTVNMTIVLVSVVEA